MTYSEQLLDAIQAHKFSETRTLLKQALDNDDPEILASLAENLSDLGFTDLAKEVYRKLIAQFPDEDLFKVYLAEILLNDGQEDDGLSLLYGVEPESDAYLESLLVQADYYQSEGLLETARAKMNQARELAPDEDAIEFGLAELDYLMELSEQALPLYQDLAERQKMFGEVNLNQRIFQTLAKLGRYEEAASFINGHKEDLLDIDSKYQAGVIMVQAKQFKQAIQYLDEVIKQSPDYVNAYPFLAQAYGMENNFEEELYAAQTGLGYNELDEELYQLGADAALKLGKQADAEDLLERGLKVNPDNSSLRLMLANLDNYEGKYQEALDLFGQLDDAELEPQAHWAMAQAWQGLDKYDQAQSEYLLAYPGLQDNAAFLRQMALFFDAAGQKNLVKQVLAKYLPLAPNDEEMQELYTDLLDDGGE
ncbi:tetratricopeptide repeat protein [Lactobacillus porci]|uniref:Tetratricopeptide repeat protein n=1 Tax=Lactobacillus porci TaxID=2012477 RepID=A0A6A8MEZ2_9LACO|nr:tetratricopeptide repeat protein [Lactobacillus porci]MST87360.1 tetratricopeptide repeat protein [Lactobacillus porci]